MFQSRVQVLNHTHILNWLILHLEKWVANCEQNLLERD